jgi:prevent-host-death family protein
MKSASIAELKADLNSYLKATKEGPVVVKRNGRAVAVLLGIQNEDDLERLLMAHSPQLQAILEKSRQQIREGQCLSHEEFWAEFNLSAHIPRKSRESKRGGKRVAGLKK